MLGANVVDGKATRFSFGELAPIIDFDRTPWYRSSAWLLPLLYCSLGGPAPDRPAVADAGARPAQASRRDARRSKGRQLWAYRSSRIAAIAILAVLIGWVVADLGDVRRSRQRSASFTRSCCRLQVLSIVAFIGGFAVMALVRLDRLAAAGGWKALDGEGVEHPAASSRRRRCSTSPWSSS